MEWLDTRHPFRVESHCPSLLQSAAATLLFGADSRPLLEKRIASCQTLSGTGALTLTALLIRRLFSGRPVYCSDPTWENHARVVADAGVRG